MGHTMQSVPEHLVGFGPPWSLTPALLGRQAHHHAGFYLSTHGSSFALKQQLSFQFANLCEAALGMSASGQLAPGNATSGEYNYSSLGDAALTFVLIWDSPVPAGSFGLEIVSPTGALNLNNPALANVQSSTWHVVRVGVPPAGGNDGQWTMRVRRTGPGQGQRENFFLAAFGNGLGRVEPASPSPYIYTGEIFRPTFRIRQSYWPTNGFDTVTGTVEIAATGLGAGALLASNALAVSTVSVGDPISARQTTLDQRAVANPNLLSEQAINSLPLRDDGQGGDTFANDHYYAAALPVAAEGEYQVHARFNFQTQGKTFTREARYSIRVEAGISTNSTVDRITPVDQATQGRTQAQFDFTPKDVLGNLFGPGRAADLDVRVTGGGQLEGSVSDQGGGQYRVVASYTNSTMPRLMLKQPGRVPVLLGGPGANEIVDGPTVFSMRPDRAVICWRTSANSDAQVEFSEAPDSALTHQVTLSESSTEHRVELAGLRGGQTYTYRVRSRTPDALAAVSGMALLTTAPNSIARMTVDRLGYNGAVTNIVSGRAFLYEPAARETTVALSTAQTFNKDNPFTNAIYSLTIPAGATSVPWTLPASAVSKEVELHASVIYGDYPSHVILKLMPASLQLLNSAELGTPFTTNLDGMFNPYVREISVPIGPETQRFFKLQNSTLPFLGIKGLSNGQLRLRY
jgi:hypothetical protein